jgi:hypothetical protein
MTLRATSPAPLADVLDLYAASVPQKPLNVKAAILQHARSYSEVYIDGDGRAVAAAMYYPRPAERHGEPLVELVFVCRPELSRHLLAFVHSFHLTRARLAEDGPIRVRAFVHSGHLPGRRLAALCGMQLIETAGGFERWEIALEGAPDECIRQRDQIPFHRA